MPQRQLARRLVVTIPIADTLAVLVEAGGWQAGFPGRILEVELDLRGTGTGAGNTDVDVNKGGTSILAAPGLRIASASATKRVRATPIGGVGHPNGVAFKKGDNITVDVDAVPATTASTGGKVYLHIAPTDV